MTAGTHFVSLNNERGHSYFACALQTRENVGEEHPQLDVSNRKPTSPVLNKTAKSGLSLLLRRVVSGLVVLSSEAKLPPYTNFSPPLIRMLKQHFTVVITEGDHTRICKTLI